MMKTKNRLVCSLAINIDSIIKITQPSMATYAKRCHADFYIQTKTQKNPPHFAKYELLQDAYDAGYEQILYVDADVYIRRGIPIIFNHYTNALFDEILLVTPNLRKPLLRAMQELDPSFDETGSYYNTGVMIFTRDGLGKLLQIINECTEFKTFDLYYEQHQLNVFLKQANLPDQKLHQRWNTYARQQTFDDPNLVRSYFLHIPGITQKNKKVERLLDLRANLP